MKFLKKHKNKLAALLIGVTLIRALLMVFTVGIRVGDIIDFLIPIAAGIILIFMKF